MPCLGSDRSNSLDNSVFTYLEISKILMMLFVGPKYICSALFDELITFFKKITPLNVYKTFKRSQRDIFCRKCYVFLL